MYVCTYMVVASGKYYVKHDTNYISRSRPVVVIEISIRNILNKFKISCTMA